MKHRRMALAAVLTAALAVPASAQSRYMLRGLVDAEAWATDTNSILLARNNGQPTALGRLQLWGAVEPLRRVVLYGLFETEASLDSGHDYEADLEQAGIRFAPSRKVVVDAGRIAAPLGGFAARRFSSRNPLIGAPDGYPVTYPLGAMLSGAIRALDYRVAVVSLPVVHENYTPEPSDRWRPALALGITPVVGLRFGAGYTWGPYLNDSLTPAQLAARPWDSYDQRLLTADAAVSVGYLELFAEAGASSYDVPGRPEPIEGLTYFVEAKYTVTPRIFFASRFERNDYPFIRPVGPTAWVARRTDFHNEEVGIGYRVGATTLLKASYRQDRWKVNGDNAAFIRPGGRAFAVQLSREMDLAEWIDRARVR